MHSTLLGQNYFGYEDHADKEWEYPTKSNLQLESSCQRIVWSREWPDIVPSLTQYIMLKTVISSFFRIIFLIMGVAQPRCSCTPGYTCRGNCIIKGLSTSTEDDRKRAYSSSFSSSGQRVASAKQQKRFHFPSICKDITEYAVSKKCCSINCIYNLVETHNILQVANAVQSARKNVYHTNANCAHQELRDLLKSGQCRDTGEVIAYFDHMKVLTATTGTPLKIKVSYGDCTGLYGIVDFR